MHPQVSILIVNFNQGDLTLDCVRSIQRHTERERYEIVVVDNGSDAAEAAKLAQARLGFEFVPLRRNLFFGEANNIAAERATGEYLLLINNDILVTPGWFDPLLATLQTQDRAGAVGAKFVFPDGRLLEAGAAVAPDGWSMQIGRSGATFPQTFVNETRIVDYCSAACLLMRRRDFLGLGGFDPIFEPAYYEDVDLAIRLRSIGLFTYYCGSSTVVHLENFTSGRIWSTQQRQSYIDRNHERLVERWGPYLRGRLESDIEPQPLAATNWEVERSLTDAAPIVLYSPLPPDPWDEEQKLLRAAAGFEGRRDVIIASDEMFSRCRVYALCRNHGIRLTSFRVRKISDIDLTNAELVVSQGAGPRQFPVRHLTLERDAAALAAFMSANCGAS
jgi:GT2 family glycosyltransferase